MSPINSPNLFPEDPALPSGSKRKIGPPFPPTGPEGETCGSCDHLMKIEYHDRIYYKCEIRGSTNGAGTDIRVKWHACIHWDEYRPKC